PAHVSVDRRWIMTGEASASIRLCKLTRQEAEIWQAKHAYLIANRLYDLNLPLTVANRPDQISNILAYDHDDVVGKIAITPCTLKLGGNYVPCIASGDLYVERDYRDKGVGSLLIFSMLSLNRTWVFGGASTDLLPLLLEWKRFKWIDENPIYYLPLSFAGAAKVFGVYLRNRIASRAATEDLPDLPQGLPTLAFWRRFPLSPDLRPLSGLDAIKTTRELLTASVKPCQVPHNIPLIERALEGREEGLVALVIRVGTEGPAHLITLYPTFEKLGIPALNKLVRRLKVMTLNEIFPPPDDVSTVIGLLALGIAKARESGADIIKICGMNGSICDAARTLKALPLLRKTVFAVFSKDVVKSRPEVVDPQNWWCRAVNEVQFSEATRISDVNRDNPSASHTLPSV
ncbi:MAG: GNAT family N-acetyltransferase, partial [Acidiferrobacterales bacterium]